MVLLLHTRWWTAMPKWRRCLNEQGLQGVRDLVRLSSSTVANTTNTECYFYTLCQRLLCMRIRKVGTMTTECLKSEGPEGKYSNYRNLHLISFQRQRQIDLLNSLRHPYHGDSWATRVSNLENRKILAKPIDPIGVPWTFQSLVISN